MSKRRHTVRAEVHELKGDSSKAQRAFGWAPQVRFDELVRRMVEAGLERVLAPGH